MFLLNDMLIRIKNGHKNNLAYVTVQYSKFCEIILKKLYEHGFILFFKKITIAQNRFLFRVYLKPSVKKFFVRSMELNSTPNGYTFCPYKDILYNRQTVYTRHSILFLSTSKGILTNLEALECKIGGVILFSFCL